MLFESLTFLLIWIFIGWLLWYLLFQVKFIPTAYYTGLGIVTVAALLTIAFMSPTGRTSELLGSLLSLLLTPLGLSLLLLSRWTLREGPNKFTSNGLAATAFTILLFASTPMVGYSFAEQLERDSIRNLGDRGPTQAIVLLGQGTTRVAGIGEDRLELTESGDLITYAAQLYRQGISNRIIVSAGFRPEANAYWLSKRTTCPDDPAAFRACRNAESTDIRILLQRMGVPASAIVIPEGELANRRELVDVRTSALDVRDEFGGTPNGARIALVASALSMARATYAFENVGFTVVPKPADFYTLPYDSPDLPNAPWRYLSIPDLIPNVDGLTVTTKVIKEYLLSVFYFLRGWVSPFRV
ncbi:MAG: hypothetical protein Fur0042_14660 [Cyanophyceae cyanobacterium]